MRRILWHLLAALVVASCLRHPILSAASIRQTDAEVGADATPDSGIDGISTDVINVIPVMGMTTDRIAGPAGTFSSRFAFPLPARQSSSYDPARDRDQTELSDDPPRPFGISELGEDTLVRMEYAGSTIWGNYYDVEVQQNYAYCLTTSGLVVVDISDPTTPSAVSQYYLPIPRDVAVEGSSVFLTTEDSSIVVLDVSVPSEPELICTFPLDGRPSAVVAANGHAFVTTDHALMVLDISVPSQLSLVSEMPYPGHYVTYNILAIEGNRALIKNAYEAWLVDVSDPSAPVVTGEFGVGGNALYDVAISGQYAYVALGWDGFATVDISDPDTGLVIGVSKFPFAIDGIRVANGCAFTSGDEQYAIDVSDPLDPRVLGNVGSGHDLGLTISDDKLFLVTMSGLLIFDISGRSYYYLGLQPYLDQWYHCAVSGNFAYLCGRNSFLVLDISDPLHPAETGSLSGRTFRYATIAGNYAYVWIDNLPSRLLVVDISDPANPVSVDSVLMADWIPRRSVVQDSLLLVAGYDALYVLSIDDPAHPSLLSQISIDTLTSIDVVASGTHAFVGLQKSSQVPLGGIQVVDISNPYQPMQDALVLGDSLATQNLILCGNVVLGGSLIVNRSRLSEFDVSSPHNTSVIGSKPISSFGIYDLLYDGELLYTAGQVGFEIFQASDLQSPLKDFEQHCSWSQSPALAVKDSVLYFINHNFYVYNLSQKESPSKLIGSYGSPKVDGPVMMRDSDVFTEISGRLIKVDISHVAAPEILGRSDSIVLISEPSIHYCGLGGDYLYAGSIGGLQVYEISGQDDPLWQLTYDPSSQFDALTVSGQYVYAVTRGITRDLLQIIDISVPLAPAIVSSLELPGRNDGVVTLIDTILAITGGAVEDSRAQLYLINVANPLSPMLLSTFTMDHNYVDYSSLDVACYRNFLFLSTALSASPPVLILDISQPANPVHIGSFPFNGVNRMAVREDLLFCANYFGQVGVLDVSELPTEAQLVGVCSTDGSAFDMAVNDSLICLSDETALVLLRWWREVVLGAEDERSDLPLSYSLAQNYPNPFNPATTIEYAVPLRADVVVEVFNILGQRVRRLVDEQKAAGSYKVLWNGADDGGHPVSTGVYFYRMQAGEFVRTKKMLLIK